ncbi:MAG: prolipoprotein diacylglyceryl transferase [Candidatus Omnitrophota bacterium]
MHPIICQIGPFTIYSYGLTLVAAFLVSSALIILEAKREKINPETILNFCFIVFIWGIAGARLLYILENAGYYLKNPLEIIMLQHGGLSWFGGLTLGTFSGIVYLKKKNLAVYKILDLIVPFVALAQAVGRIGCLLNGCCFGKVSKFGIYFPAHNSLLIPTQIYSSLVLIFIFMILRFLQNRPHRASEIFFTYLLLYSLKRFFIEFWRFDNQIIFLGLTLFQVMSIVIFFLSFFKLLLIRRPKD